jgi:malonyl-CoA O-methyltransferase
MPNHSNAFSLNKMLIKQAFNQAAASYDDAAVLQREVANRLNERLDYIKINPELILEIGSGTGYHTQLLTKRYPKSNVMSLDIAHAMLVSARGKTSWLQRIRKKQHWLCADAEQLPLIDNSVDMITSNLTLQWCSNLDQTFSDFYRCLKPGGLIMFTTFGPDTLKELRASWRQVDNYNHVNAFLDMHDVGDALLRNGFSDPVMDAENITLTYKEVMKLMRELKAIGAHNVTLGRQRGLTGKDKLKKLFSAYEQFRSGGVLPCTYEIVYGHAWKLDKPAKNTQHDQTVRIPLNTIKRPQ